MNSLLKLPSAVARWRVCGLIAVLLALGAGGLSAAEEVIRTNQPGVVRAMRPEALYRAFRQSEVPAVMEQKLDFNDALRTGPYGTALVRLNDGKEIRLDKRTRLEMVPRPADTNLASINLLEGSLMGSQHALGRGRLVVQMPNGARALPKGTEFTVSYDPASGESTVTVFDGAVDLENDADAREIAPGFQGSARRGEKIRVRPILEARNVVQWWIYYPAVLHLEDLSADETTKQRLAESITAYRAGDLVEALQKFPGYPAAAPLNEAERIYHAALLLGAGAVEEADQALANANAAQPGVRALRTLIAAVAPPLDARRADPVPAALAPATASEWLAVSYAHQATNNLPDALAAARQCVELAPDFGYGWARMAELEFSFRKTAAAQSATTRAMELSPRNAQAQAVQGFLFAAENKMAKAHAAFDRAIALDPWLANGWLGRGLIQFRKGETQAGRDDLQQAAAVEPRRSLTRSYLGKAWAEIGNGKLAELELAQARLLDTNDPTPLLYSALLKQTENRINEAVRDLETSVELNDHRALYRSRQLLDEDLAVRSANLASIYRDAGMSDVSVREAARAVGYDYANYSAHLFLADSYEALRDPARFNLRYETVWFNELLLANILAPVGAGRLSQGVSAQEYSQLFQSDGLGIASSTEVRSDGMLRERASQWGTFGRTSYALDLDYQHHNGVRPNNELDSIEWYSTIKQQITPEDSALLLVKYEDYASGDNFQYYDPRDARRHFSFEEQQEPILVGAWHHEWSPGVHTMFLGGRLLNEQQFSDRDVSQIILLEDATGKVVANDTTAVDVDYRNRLEIYTAELNQVIDGRWATLSFGARYQNGDFETENLLDDPTRVPFLLPDPPARASTSEDFERVTGYGYLTLKPTATLRLIGGLAYDVETIPQNFRHPPITSGEDDRSLLGPKAGFVWSPLAQTTFRGIYTKSLGGVSLDESYRLEQTQIAGFPQAFRTLIPESTPGVGSVSAPEFETFGLALDLKLGSRTYAGLQVERLSSEVRRHIGAFTAQDGNIPATASAIEEHLDFLEQSVAVSINQLLGERFVAGAAYKLARAELEDRYPGTPSSVLTPAYPSQSATLHHATGYLLFNHACGFFARAEVLWYGQQNSGYSGTMPGDDVVQENIYVGWRFPRNHGEVRLGILNLSGEDYRLNPLSAYEELPRERVFEAKFTLVF